MARGLPLSGRLAVRDAARHRHRTGPATSAIAVAVAGSVVFAFVLAGRAEANRISYVAYLPGHVLSVSGTQVLRDEHLVDTASTAAAAKLPNATVVRPRAVTVGTGSRPRDTQEIFALPIRKQCRIDCSGLAVAVADPTVMALTLGRTPTPQEMAAIAAGKVLVVSPRFVESFGQVTFAVSGRSMRMSAVAADVAPLYRDLPGAFVSPDVVQAHGWGTIVPDMLVAFDGSASQTQIDDAKTAIEDRGAYPFLDTGPSDPSRILLVIAGIAAAFVTLVGVAISVALSAAEGKADLATLAAVGAPPRRRRSLAAAQALLVGGLGCATGLLLGVFVSYTLRATIGAPGFVVPWRNLLVVGVVVPLVAMLIAAVFTPSRLPLTVRRSW
jgi:putative ABC transport system permease protein